MLGIEAIKITPELLIDIAEIDEFKGLWNGLDRHTTGLNMLREVADYGRNLHTILKPLQNKEISAEIIKAIHAMQIKQAGATFYKTSENKLNIMDADGLLAGFLETAPPSQVEPLMNKLVSWANEALEVGKIHPLIVVAIFTAVFLQVSPFEEGNQRTVYFTVLLLMMKAGYAYAPYVPLDRFMSENATKILKALRHNQHSLEAGRPDWSVWLEAFIDILKAQKDALDDRLNEKDKDLSHLPTLSARILAQFEDHERLQMNDIIKLTNGRRSTIKLRIGELVEQGYLKRHGQARNTWYALN